MSNFSLALSVYLLLFSALSFSQERAADSSFINDLDEVVVAATRNERKLSNVAVPTTVISQKQIQQAGSLRVKDILSEQTGLVMTSGFGAGIQMQGLNPDYTLIMIDGQPLIGRTSGVLDLNRIAVGNIKKIEIVKGPSSSLYGSEALAGVINIITDKSFNRKLDAGIRYGTYRTVDANVYASSRIGKLGVSGFINNYNTNGYSIRPSTVDRLVLPVWRLTHNVHLSYPLSNSTSLSLAVRYNHELIKNELAVTNNGQITISKGRELNDDWNITPVLNHRFSDRIKTAVRLYGTLFEGSQRLTTTAGETYNDLQKHQFYRAENQSDFILNDHHSIMIGGGIVNEYLNSTRYDNEKNLKKNSITYGFIQSEWSPDKQVSFITGFRYDKNNLYASAFSPKIAAQFKLSEKLRFNASYGRGFKAPDFRQLYLNFTNSAAGSYSVYGTIDAYRLISELQRQGQIEQLESDFYRIKDLKPEFSNGLNIGFSLLQGSELKISANLFRNDIENLIDTRLVALRKVGGGQTTQIFSYLNVKRAYTKGAETEINYRMLTCMTVSAGYQFLSTADKDQVKDIKAQKVYTRDANGFSRIMQRSEYFGLPNKSRHMINVKLLYESSVSGLFANTRAIYRSKWAVTDIDGNGLYNSRDEFAEGYVSVNASAGKTFRERFRVQAGIDNLLNYVDVSNLPNMPGRTFYTGISYSFIPKINK